MVNHGTYFFALSFHVMRQAGIALVVAEDETHAFDLLKRSGRYCHSPEKYVLDQCKSVGTSKSCAYGLLLESFSSAEVAYQLFVDLADEIRGIEGAPVLTSDSDGVIYCNGEMLTDVIKVTLEQKMAITPEEIFHKFIWRIDVLVENGANMMRENMSADCRAVVYLGDVDVTDSITPNYFSWMRSSGNENQDNIWNSRHEGVGKTIHVTRGDVNKSCTFTCCIPISAILNI